MVYFPGLEVRDFEKAIGLITRGGLNSQHAVGNEVENELVGGNRISESNAGNNQQIAESSNTDTPSYLENGSFGARNRITRIQFSWYQFNSFPSDVIGAAYSNLQHVDIRQNSSLKCIKSIVVQLPNLSSLNLSDFPNIRTLAPLATALPTFSHQLEEMGDDVAVMEVMDPPLPRRLNLRHLWMRGCNLSNMSEKDWELTFDALSKSTGPLERLTLSRNNMSYLHGAVGKLKSLNYLFMEDNDGADDGGFNGQGFKILDELALPNLRFASLSGNNITRLSRTMGRLPDNCDVHLRRNPNLYYPPFPYQHSVKLMRSFFHDERMTLLRGTILCVPHFKKARWRANERLYRPGGWGYFICKERFEETMRRSSIALMGE